jgi:hypothetical protein
MGIDTGYCCVKCKTMQALLDENRLLRAEHHAGQYISRNSPDHTWEKWVDACDAADAKLQEQNDEN